MSDTIRIGTLELLGTSTSIDVEEGRNFRRITVQRRRLLFQEMKKVGEIHVYMDQVDAFQELLDTASWVMKRVGEVGFEAASREVAEGRKVD